MMVMTVPNPLEPVREQSLDPSSLRSRQETFRSIRPNVWVNACEAASESKVLQALGIIAVQVAQQSHKRKLLQQKLGPRNMTAPASSLGMNRGCLSCSSIRDAYKPSANFL